MLQFAEGFVEGALTGMDSTTLFCDLATQDAGDANNISAAHKGSCIWKAGVEARKQMRSKEVMEQSECNIAPT